MVYPLLKTINLISINFNILVMKKFYLFFLALFAFTMSASAGIKVLYHQDFESASDAASAGWTSPNVAAGLSIYSDDYGKFLQFATGANNDRSAHTIWGQDIVKGAGSTSYSVAFDFNFNAFGNNHTTSEITVMSDETTCTKKANGNFRGNSSNWLFDLTQLAQKDADDKQINISASGDQPFALNGDSAKTVSLTAGKWYTVALDIDTVARVVSCQISDLEGNSVAAGNYEVPAGVDMAAAGIYFLGGRYQCQASFDNIKVQTEIDEEVANNPSVALVGVNNHQRVYNITIMDGETLHLKYNGEEKEIYYGDTSDGVYVWSNNPNYDPDNVDVTDACSAGTLEAWTTAGSATSEVISTEVENDIVALPTATATISNVDEGFSKEYTLTVSNKEVPLQPTLFLSYEFQPADGGTALTAEELPSGAKVTLPSKGTLTVTTSALGYGESKTSLENSIEYKQAKDYNLAHLTASDFAKMEFAADGNVTGKYATYGRLYWYDKDSVKTAYNEIPQFTKKASAWASADSIVYDNLAFTEIPSVNVYFYQGVGMVLEGQKGDDGKGSWINTLYLVVNGLTDKDFIKVSSYNDYGKNALHPVVADQDEFLASDNAPVTAVLKGTEKIGLYRVSDCLARIQIYSAANGGSTGIKGVSSVETAAPSVKKMMTKNGLVIVKGDKVFSVAGAQIK